MKTQLLRRVIQVLSLIISNGYYKVIQTKIIYDGKLKGFCVPFLNCHACPTAFFTCPIGNLQYFVINRRIPFDTIGFLGIIGSIIGRAPCAWLCPFGLLQDLLYRIKSKKIQIPQWMNSFKYAFLIIFVIILPYFTGVHWFSQICPDGSLIAGIPWVLWNPVNPETNRHIIDPHSIGLLFVIKMLILVVFFAGAIISSRVFCRIMCPLGAIFALFNSFSLLQMNVRQSCTKCNKCWKICPMEIKLYEKPKSADCIRCMKCIKCPHIEFSMNPLSISKRYYKYKAIQEGIE